MAVDDPSSVDLLDDRSGSPSDLNASLSKRSCSIAVSTARRIWEVADVKASEGSSEGTSEGTSEGVNSEPRERREAGEGRRMGYVRTDTLSTANDRELKVWKLFALYRVDLESASWDNFDFFGVPTMLFSIGGGGIVDSVVAGEGGWSSYWP